MNNRNTGTKQLHIKLEPWRAGGQIRATTSAAVVMADRRKRDQATYDERSSSSAAVLELALLGKMIQRGNESNTNKV
jgi:hypothetical protein